MLGIGVIFSAVLPTPQPHFYAYPSPEGFDVVVADREHVPPGVEVRDVVPGAPVALRRPGEAMPQEVPPDELQRRLEQSGVWARGQVPATSRGRTATFVPVVIVGLGLLALAWALPAFAVRGRHRPTTQAALLVVVLLVLGMVVQRGGLGWPGRSAIAATPKLEWR